MDTTRPKLAHMGPNAFTAQSMSVALGQRALVKLPSRKGGLGSQAYASEKAYWFRPHEEGGPGSPASAPGTPG